MPGAALTPTAATRSARSTHHSSGGSLSPVRIRPRGERRAGSTNTASTDPMSAARTSASRVETASPSPWTPRVLLGHPEVHRVAVDREHAAAAGEREEVAADPATQVGDTLRGPVPGGPVPRDDLGGRLLQPRAREEHVLCPGELGRGAHPQLLLPHGVGHELGRVARPQLRAQAQGLGPGDVLARAGTRGSPGPPARAGPGSRSVVITDDPIGAPRGARDGRAVVRRPPVAAHPTADRTSRTARRSSRAAATVTSTAVTKLPMVIHLSPFVLATMTTSGGRAGRARLDPRVTGR